MKLDKAIKMLEILKFIHINSKVKAPEIRDYLGLIHVNPPNKEEKELYSVLNDMAKGGYIEKIPIQRMGAGGAKFIFKIMELGSSMLAHLRDYNLLSRGVSFSELDEKAKDLSLERMLRLYEPECFELIFDSIQNITGGIFDKADFQKQQSIIEIINDSVLKIRNKTYEIAKSFF